MNRKQRACIKVGLLLLVLTTLFPPWSSRYLSSYGFLFYPPFVGATVNLTRLFVEWVLIALVTSGAFLLQNKEHSTTSNTAQAARQSDPLAALLGPDQKRTERENLAPHKPARQWMRKFIIPVILAFTVCVVWLAYYESRRIVRNLPQTEVSKLVVQQGFIDVYGSMQLYIYNGSEFVLTEMKVSISVFSGKGDAVISKRVYRVPAYDFYPQQSKALRTDVGFTVAQDQKWEWFVVGAKGRPE